MPAATNTTRKNHTTILKSWTVSEAETPTYPGVLYGLLSDYENCQRALEIGNAKQSAVKNTIPGDLPSSDLKEIENVIRGHKAVGPQLEMNR